MNSSVISYKKPLLETPFHERTSEHCYSNDWYRWAGYKVAKELFNLSILDNYLNLLLSVCNSYNIKLILSTFVYNSSEFQNEPRITYLQLIKKINNLYRDFAKKNNLLLIDFENEINFDEKDIKKKWQVCDAGNKKRVVFAGKVLENHYRELKKNVIKN